ncbi:hypothetical protein BKA70DRAFT_1246545 [Coprinopsis sp. MPI-PUGE-AT-0042]|nr:hypothetical protein BKA70DRAFT_1246545 [Coprinopsis sp. MPI-PUGE-AT-0042]
MNTHPVFPNEILDAIVDSAVDNLSTRSVFGLVPLLKSVALTSQSLRVRAQRHLFFEIRLQPFNRRKGRDGIHDPRTIDLTIFQGNPQLIEYPRSLAIIVHSEEGRSEFPPHFLLVILPFFTRKIGTLDHLNIYLNYRIEWASIPTAFQDAIVQCIKGNRLKSFELLGIDLPRSFVDILPSTLEACNIGVCAENDPSFAAKYIEPRHKRGSNQANTVSPTHLEIRWVFDDPTMGWVTSQEDTFFQRVASLDVGVVTIAAIAALMDRMPNALTRLSLRHWDNIHSLELQHDTLQGMIIHPMPHLQELKVSVRVESDSVVTCPSQAAVIVADYISPAYVSIRIFRLVIEWNSSSPVGRYLTRTAEGFARLDDLLSDRSILGSLVEVELDIRPVCSGIDRIADEQARLRNEALEVFYKTVGRVDTFSVKASDAFK